MSISTQYTFDNAANFNLSNTQISGSNALLALINNPAQTFNQAFSSDSGFTYNSNLSEFNAGILQQKDQSGGARLGVKFTGNTNAQWNKDGSTTATVNGSPTIVSDKLQCFGTQGVRYPATNNGVGTLRCKYTPNYTGVPPSNINLFAVHKTSGNQSCVVFSHSPSVNTIRATINNNTGAAIAPATIIGVPSFVAGTEYEIEGAWDSSTGMVYFFIDGVLLGSLSLGSWTHGVGTGVVSVGADTVVYNTAQGTFDDVLKFDTVQHTSSYTAGYTVPDTLYSESQVVAPSFVYSGIGALQSLTSITVTEVGSPQYTIDGKYWDGAAWVASDGSYVQSSPLSDINTNIGSLALDVAGTIPYSIVFASSNTQSSVDDFILTHVGQQYSTDGDISPVQCIEAKSMSAYSHSVSEPASTGVRVIINVDGVDQYWNGASWVASDGTFAQANTESDVNTNISSLSLGSNSTICIKWVLNTSDQQATPTITSASITYEFGAVETSTSVCQVYGYLKDITDAPVVGATVSFDLNTSSESQYQEASNRIMSTEPKTVTTDANGYFSISLIRTSEYSEGGNYSVQIILSNGNVIGGTAATALGFDVPDSTTKDITDLLPAA